MELSEIEDLPKKLLREEAGRTFRLQASASMDMWMCVKRAINAAEKAKAYKDLSAGVPRLARLSRIMRTWRRICRLPNGRSRFMRLSSPICRQPWSRRSYRQKRLWRRMRRSRWLWQSRSRLGLRRSRLLSRRLSEVPSFFRFLHLARQGGGLRDGGSDQPF
ncbi:unnamed protein product [Prunus armeniaca]